MITPEQVELKRARLGKWLTRNCKHEGIGALSQTRDINRCMCQCKLDWRVDWRAFEAGIPEKFWHWDPATIDTNVEIFEELIEPWPKIEMLRRVLSVDGDLRGHGLFLQGENGTGKSTFLSWILMELIRTSRITVYYTTTLRLMADHQATIGPTSEHYRAKMLLEKKLGSTVLVIDEVGKETFKKGDSWSRLKFETLIRDRIDGSLPTLLGSNVSIEAISRTPDKGGYGPTLGSLIVGGMVPIAMMPGDRREQIGHDKMDRILE